VELQPRGIGVLSFVSLTECFSPDLSYELFDVTIMRKSLGLVSNHEID
jgi:hypothetical protein